MTCAKRTVVATLIVGKRTFLGMNLCRRPQATCPREPGEDYQKCRHICQQPWHAEEDAINNALVHGVNPDGGTMVVNYPPCNDCKTLLDAWHIQWTVVP